MAENLKFNNSDMFKDVTTNTGHTDIDADNKSEVLATQGNVINSIKTFWNNLRKKLVYAITRTDTSKAVGDIYIPVYVDENGEVKQCNGKQITVSSITNNNIDIGDISPIIGTTLYIKVTIGNNSNNSLKIDSKNVFYPTGVGVTANIIANTNLLVVYNGESWILINKMNEVKTSGKTSENGAGGNGYSGLMTADDKAKLETIDWDANKYELTAATSTSLGGVKSKTTGTTQNRYYDVQVNSDGTMKVNVPWTDTLPTHYTALLKAGGINSKENQATKNGNTYLMVVENNAISSQLNIKGTKGVNVSSSSTGAIIIEGQGSTSILSSSNYDDSTGYLVYGPGRNNNTNKFYLAGNGNWENGMLVPIPTSGDSGKILKCGPNGPYWDSLPS